MRILVCSDIHFFAPSFHPKQLFSKEIIGNLCAFFTRKHHFLSSHAEMLLDQLSSLKVTHLLCLGDFTTTSSKKEFALVQRFIAEAQRKRVTVYAIPGNHDNYTKMAYEEKRFYHMLEDLIDLRDLSKDRVAAYSLDEKLWLILLDTTLKTPLSHATGLFSKKIEAKLKEILDSIPKDHEVIVANHFPIKTKKLPTKSLQRKLELERLLSNYPQVRFYFCGHDHRHTKINLPTFQMINPSSLTLKKYGGFCILEPKKQLEIYRPPSNSEKGFQLKEIHDVV